MIYTESRGNRRWQARSVIVFFLLWTMRLGWGGFHGMERFFSPIYGCVRKEVWYGIQALRLDGKASLRSSQSD